MPGPVRVLLVKTSSMGDVVHALPVVDDILAHDPDAVIDWLVEPAYASLLRLHPGLRRVIAAGWRSWWKRPWSPASWRGWRQLRAQLHSVDYDWVIDLQGLIKSALLARQARGVHVGWRGAACREPLAAWFYQRALAGPRYDSVPAVTRCRTLSAWALGYAVDSASRYGLRPPTLRPEGLDADQDYAVLLTATSRDDKLWPESDWVALGTALGTRGLALLLAWGSAPERARAQRIADALNAAGCIARVAPRQHDLPTWSGLLAGARLAVGVDTGLTHLAAAVRCPVLALYVATSPRHVGVEADSAHCNLGDAGAAPSVADALAACAQLLAGGASR